MKVLKPEFFNREYLKVAEDLLGKFLVRKIGNKIERYKITETEAYGGPEDLASHARYGQTKRTKVMWSESGTIYVYFTYGMHYMLNIVTGKKGTPGAILIRGLEGVSGPGRVTKKLLVDKNLNGKILGKKSGLWVEESLKQKFKIAKTPRIGVDYAGLWSKKLHRFVMI